jgi:pimeloyl-ACP methyl ester carboxylesterase
MTPSGWIRRDGLRLALHDAGGAGRPVLFQHGLGGDARQTAEAFPDQPGWRCVTLECRGHGASEAGEALSFDLFAGDLAQVAEALDPPLVMGGISMGAALSLRLAVRRPDLVRALILVRPAWGTGAAPANMAAVAEVAATMARLPRGEDRAAFLAGETAARLRKTSPDNLASLTGYFDRTPRCETIRLLSAISADDPGLGADDLAALRLPVLVCATTEDEIHPAALAQGLARQIAGARLVDLPPKGRDKAAHLAALHQAITTFLQELAP